MASKGVQAEVESAKRYSISGKGLYFLAQAMFHAGRNYGRTFDEVYDGQKLELHSLEAAFEQVCTYGPQNGGIAGDLTEETPSEGRKN